MIKLDSKKKKIVIFADPHNDIDAVKAIIHKEDGDINICLGDWFDSFVYDEPRHYSETAKYLLNEFLPNPKNYTLIGNHDLHYLYRNSWVMCSGYEDWKYTEIDEIIGKHRENFRKKFHWAIVVDDILLTHGGLDRRLVKPKCKTNDDIINGLFEAVNDAESKLLSDDEHWFYQVGHSRGGRYRTGGLVWCDFDREFQPIDDFRQIVGHTSQWQTGRAKQHDTEGFASIVDANNLCIDCSLNQYLTLSNGKLELKDYTDI